nr:hypothetical protein [Tanacetum cinerariifolium]
SSSSAQTKKQDDKTKIEDKGKSPVESFTGYRDLNAKFEDCSKNSRNEVNAAGFIVPTVGKNYLNSTNTFSVVGPSISAAGPSISAAGPSNTLVSPTYGKSSFTDASQLLNDPDMPELEDITYSDDEDVVSAEADFNNLESSIPVSPIPTTRIHKDHLVSQIIGDLSSTTQTRSMTRAVNDQGGTQKGTSRSQRSKNDNKLGFIDGSCKRDNKNHDLANQLDMCNYVVVTWILNSLSPDLFAVAIYAKTAYEMWNDLKETYDKVDGCFEFVGYPTGYVKKNFNANSRPVSSNNATKSNSPISLSNEQLARLMILLNDNVFQLLMPICQMHNNIMAAGSRDRPPMLATGRYAQWKSCFIRHIDTRPNGDALRKCILQGPYKLSTVIIPAQPVTDDSLAVPEHTSTRQFRNQRTMTVAGARETVGNQKGKRLHVSQREDVACKQVEKGVPLQAEQADWLVDTDEEIDEQELEAHYSYMAKI